METAEITAKRRPGRPLGFNREAALHQAMLLFWRHGYEATSVNDLVAAMGITPPSLYTAFGDKKQLFLETVARYVSGPLTASAIIDNASTAREAAEGLLRAAAIGFTGDNTPSGCLLATSTISCSEAAADVQHAIAAIRRDIEEQLRRKIDLEWTSDPGEHPLTSDALAGLVSAVIQGMSTLARDGASRAKLEAITRAAMQAWPPP